MSEPILLAVADTLAACGAKIVGLAGSVAAGKSTLAAQLAQALTRRGNRVSVVTTDGFLLPNAALEARGLMERKGFPESYDAARLQRFFDDLRAERPTAIPVYSHRIYDIVAGEEQILEPADLTIVEGVIALQPSLVGENLDVGIYLDAAEADLFRWYRGRLIGLRDAAHADPDSYFQRFLPLPDEAWEARMAGIWNTINLPNLREHIAPTKLHAQIVLSKAADHALSVERIPS